MDSRGRISVVVAAALVCLALMTGPAAAATNSPATVWWMTSSGAHFDAAASVAGGAHGAVYVAGTTTTASRGTDITLSRLGSDAWDGSYDSAAHGWDSAVKALVAPDDALIVAGLMNTPASPVIATFCCEPAGAERWESLWTAPIAGTGRVADVGVGGDLVYVCGTAKRQGSGSDQLALGYSLALPETR